MINGKSKKLMKATARNSEIVIPFTDTTWDNYSVKISYVDQQIPSLVGLPQFCETVTVSGIMQTESIQRSLRPDMIGMEVNNYFKHLNAAHRLIIFLITFSLGKHITRKMKQYIVLETL